MKSLLLAVTCFLSLGATLTASAQVPVAWGNYLGDASHSGYVDVATTISSTSPVAKWSRPQSAVDYATGGIVVKGDIIVLAGAKYDAAAPGTCKMRGEIRAIYLATGSHRVALSTPAGLSAPALFQRNGEYTDDMLFTSWDGTWRSYNIANNYLSTPTQKRASTPGVRFPNQPVVTTPGGSYAYTLGIDWTNEPSRPLESPAITYVEMSSRSSAMSVMANSIPASAGGNFLMVADDRKLRVMGNDAYGPHGNNGGQEVLWSNSWPTLTSPFSVTIVPKSGWVSQLETGYSGENYLSFNDPIIPRATLRDLVTANRVISDGTEEIVQPVATDDGTIYVIDPVWGNPAAIREYRTTLYPGGNGTTPYGQLLLPTGYIPRNGMLATRTHLFVPAAPYNANSANGSEKIPTVTFVFQRSNGVRVAMIPEAGQMALVNHHLLIASRPRTDCLALTGKISAYSIPMTN